MLPSIRPGAGKAFSPEKGKRRLLALGLLGLALLLIVVASAGGDDGWKQAIEPREWSFPADHGSHPDFRTEWWYFTGNLRDTSGRRYGYQLTFFRQGILLQPGLPGNPWSIRDIYLAHFTITDLENGRFYVSERISRTGPGLSGSDTRLLDVWLLTWSARSTNGVIRLTAKDGERQIDFELRPRKPVVLHGANGLSRKGERPGQASYYASLTDLATTGTMQLPGAGKPLQVKGQSWFDHEFGSNQLSPGQAGWDWFGLHLSDGRDLMLYVLRRHDGSVDMASGTLVERDGTTKSISAAGMKIDVTKKWKSPRSSGVYPARWTILLPQYGISLYMESALADQELVTRESTGVTYWEGVVTGGGRSKGQSVTCEGYAELTGYAGSLKGLF